MPYKHAIFALGSYEAAHKQPINPAPPPLRQTSPKLFFLASDAGDLLQRVCLGGAQIPAGQEFTPPGSADPPLFVQGPEAKATAMGCNATPAPPRGLKRARHEAGRARAPNGCLLGLLRGRFRRTDGPLGDAAFIRLLVAWVERTARHTRVGLPLVGPVLGLR